MTYFAEPDSAARLQERSSNERSNFPHFASNSEHGSDEY